MKQQTAVEWLRDKLFNEFSFSFSDNIFEQAKQMEKEQITDSYIMGSYDMAAKEFRPEQYYNETFTSTLPT